MMEVVIAVLGIRTTFADKNKGSEKIGASCTPVDVLWGANNDQMILVFIFLIKDMSEVSVGVESNVLDPVGSPRADGERNVVRD